MILDKTSSCYIDSNTAYRIGDRVYANSQSPYEGLYGEIIEIRTEMDTISDDAGIEIFCKFDSPVFPNIREQVEKRFSELLNTSKTVDELDFDYVLMALKAIQILYEQQPFSYHLPVFFIVEEWDVNGKAGSKRSTVTDIHTARDRIQRILSIDISDGIIAQLVQEPDFLYQFQGDQFECWLDGSRFENHYCAYIVPSSVSLSPAAMRTIANYHTQECYKEDFITQVSGWDALSGLSEEEYQRYIGNPMIPSAIETQLNNSVHYWDEYWDCISEAAQQLLHPSEAEEENI